MNRSELLEVSDIRLRPSAELVGLIDQMYRAGGFMAKNLAEAAGSTSTW